MKTLSKIQLQALALGAAGVLVTGLSHHGLASRDALAFEPNPAAMARSPYGRTAGIALQGPVNRFWDRGIGSIEGKQALLEGDRPDQKLFNTVVSLREGKSATTGVNTRSQDHYREMMGRVESKLKLAWKMDPRNFGNYAIYQMFLWENFSGDAFEADMTSRELSLATLELSLQDEGSPSSLLTAGQAAYDIVFAARTSSEQDPAEAAADIEKYGKLLPNLIEDYDQLVASIQGSERWENISEVKKDEFQQRKVYLNRLNLETKQVLQKYTSIDTNHIEGGLQL